MKTVCSFLAHSVCADHCVAAQGSEGVQSAWTEAFKQNSKWKGRYDYHGDSVSFTLVIHSASERVVKATLQARITQLELIGNNTSLSFLLS